MNQSVFASLYRHWIWIGPGVFVLALGGLIYSISGLVATIRRARLFQAPLSAAQEIQFGEAGRIVLCTEGPRLSTRFAGLNFELRGIDGDPVPGRRSLFRARTSGISTVRTEHSIFEIPRPGRYVLTVTGLGVAPATDAHHAIVFMRPHLMQTTAFIVGILMAAFPLIGSLVFFLLRLRETGGV